MCTSLVSDFMKENDWRWMCQHIWNFFYFSIVLNPNWPYSDKQTHITFINRLLFYLKIMKIHNAIFVCIIVFCLAFSLNKRMKRIWHKNCVHKHKKNNLSVFGKRSTSIKVEIIICTRIECCFRKKIVRTILFLDILSSKVIDLHKDKTFFRNKFPPYVFDVYEQELHFYYLKARNSGTIQL